MPKKTYLKREPVRVYSGEEQALEEAKNSARAAGCDIFVLGHGHPESSRLGPQPVVAGDFRSTGQRPDAGPYVRVAPDGTVERVGAPGGVARCAYDDVSPTMRHFIGAREGFRRLGFSADDLYLDVTGALEIGGALGAYVLLKTQDKEFRMFVGDVSDGEAFVAEYKRVAAAMAAGRMPARDVKRMLFESEAATRSAEFVISLQRKGIRIPGPKAN